MTSIKWKSLEGAETQRIRVDQQAQAEKDFAEGLVRVAGFQYKDEPELQEIISECIAEARSSIGYDHIISTGKNWRYDSQPSPAYEQLMEWGANHGTTNPARKCNREWANQERHTIAKACFAAQKASAEQEPIRVHTQFYKDAELLDQKYSKSGHNSYWHSDVELFARAGAAWIKDRLNGQCDFLVGHADAPGTGPNSELLHTSPQGDERKQINQAFDMLLGAIKDKGLLHERGLQVELAATHDVSTHHRSGQVESVDDATAYGTSTASEISSEGSVGSQTSRNRGIE